MVVTGIRQAGLRNVGRAGTASYPTVRLASGEIGVYICVCTVCVSCINRPDTAALYQHNNAVVSHWNAVGGTAAASLQVCVCVARVGRWASCLHNQCTRGVAHDTGNTSHGDGGS